MPQSGIDVHNQQRPPVETVAKVAGQGDPLGSKEVVVYLQPADKYRRLSHRLS